VNSSYFNEDGKTEINPTAFGLNIVAAIRDPNCGFTGNPITDVYYPANELFNPESGTPAPAAAETPDEAGNNDEPLET
jgi:hypothetical protein